MELDAVVQRVLGNIFVELEASGRHVHVTKAQAQVLFGHPLTPKRPLSQPGQYLANEREDLKMWQCWARSEKRDRWRSL